MIRILSFLLIYSFILSACGGLKDAGKVLRNEKIRTTDEFLIKKRNPLVLPPNFEEVPAPGTIIKKKEDEKEKIKQILNVKEIENNGNKSSTIEETILKRIRK